MASSPRRDVGIEFADGAIGNGGGDWAFSFRVLTPEGKDLVLNPVLDG